MKDTDQKIIHYSFAHVRLRVKPSPPFTTLAARPNAKNEKLIWHEPPFFSRPSLGEINVVSIKVRFAFQDFANILQQEPQGTTASVLLLTGKSTMDSPNQDAPIVYMER